MGRKTQAMKRRKTIKSEPKHRVVDIIPEKRQTRSCKVPGKSSGASVHRIDACTLKDSSYQQTYMSKYANRTVVVGKCIDFESFSANHCEWLYNLFSHQGWVKLLTTPSSVYPELVREFYTHMDISSFGAGILRSWVRGKSIVLSTQKLSEVLKIPNGGISDFPNNTWSKHQSFDKQKCMELLLGDRCVVRGDGKPSSNKLDYDMRLLHLIIQKTLNPRNGNKGSVTYLDVFLMYGLAGKVRINLPYFMLNYMKTVGTQFKQGLGYGMWLTFIFQNAGVCLTDIPPIAVTNDDGNCKSKYLFDIRTLEVYMKYTYDDGIWVKYKDRRRVHMREEMSENDDDEDDDILVVGSASQRKEQVEPDRLEGAELWRAAMRNSIVVRHMLQEIHPDKFNKIKMQELERQADAEVKLLIGEVKESSTSEDSYEDDDVMVHPTDSVDGS